MNATNLALHCATQQAVQISTQQQYLLAASVLYGKRRQPANLRPRSRRSVSSIYEELGEDNFRQAYRMDYETFRKLERIITKQLRIDFHRGRPNGPVTPEMMLSCAIQYFAGGSVWDIMLTHGVSRTQLYRCIWIVVDLINTLSDFTTLIYPDSHEVQKRIADEFKLKSRPGFPNCGGCIDGLLLWIEKPTKVDCHKSKCNSGKFYCGRKNKYGLNMQAVCDAKLRFLHVSIENPGSASDFLSFATSSLHAKLNQKNFLVPGICLFGDNAYVNTSYMVTPYLNVSEGTKDNFNFFQSQLRINIECAFGMLVSRWRILKTPMSGIRLGKVVSLTLAICRLHNFIIDNGTTDSYKVPKKYVKDPTQIVDMQDDEDGNPLFLLHGGNHFDEFGSRIRLARRYFNLPQQEVTTPRDHLKHMVEEQDLCRPSIRTNITK